MHVDLQKQQYAVELWYVALCTIASADTCKWLQVASGLVAMHSSEPQVRHGSLSLSSLLLDQDACVKIADAGVHDLMTGPSTVSDDVRSFGMPQI
jgi:hypothetical protein